MWCEIIKQILADMRQPLQYVPWALIIVVLGLVVTIVLSEKKDGKKASVRFFRILFAIYILVVIQITFFSQRTRFQKWVHESGTVFHVGIQRGYPCIFY